MIEDLARTAERTAVSIFWPVYEFVHDGKSRYFWVYVVTGVALAMLVQWRRTGAWRLPDGMFARETWLSASAINDYALLFLRPVLSLSILSWAVFKGGWLVEAVESALRWVGVAGTIHDAPALALALALTIALFIVDDFLKWAIHTIAHRSPMLWEFHKVHHSAEVLNFATAERFHPFESFLTSAVVGAGIAVVNGIFIGLAGETLTPLTVAGANIFLFSFNLFGGVLRHSPVWVSFGPSIERWVISPAMHQIHHSNDPRYFDKNMGNSLSVWDRWFGTLAVAEEPVTSYGIGAETADFRSLTTILVRPMVNAFMILKKRIGFGPRLSGGAEKMG